METLIISDYRELNLKIIQLRANKLQQEEQLKALLQEFAETLKPVNIIKQSLHELAEDNEVRSGMVKAGVNIGATILTNWLSGKQNGLKGALASILMGIADKETMSENSSGIISGLSKLLQRRKNKISN